MTFKFSLVMEAVTHMLNPLRKAIIGAALPLTDIVDSLFLKGPDDFTRPSVRKMFAFSWTYGWVCQTVNYDYMVKVKIGWGIFSLSFTHVAHYHNQCKKVAHIFIKVTKEKNNFIWSAQGEASSTCQPMFRGQRPCSTFRDSQSDRYFYFLPLLVSDSWGFKQENNPMITSASSYNPMMAVIKGILRHSAAVTNTMVTICVCL